MLSLARLIRRAGRVAEPAPPLEQLSGHASEAALPWRGSVQLRHVDAGSCNGCEVEIGGCFSPVYDIERYGIRLVASPRHADGLLVTGVVTRNMAEALVRTHAATPDPSVVVAVGDCACSGGVFADGHGVLGPVADFVPVDVAVPGCPPRPAEIVAALRSVSRR